MPARGSAVPGVEAGRPDLVVALALGDLLADLVAQVERERRVGVRDRLVFWQTRQRSSYAAPRP